jgi:hydrogenase maturation protein HypF
MTHVPHSPPNRLLRLRWSVAGQVQGVGFRPFVYRAARDQKLTGTVRNTPAGVIIEGQGTDDQLRAFERSLRTQHPTAARVEHIVRQEIDLEPREAAFEVAESDEEGDLSAAVTPDLATCPDCLREISHNLNPRRHRHALTNCTACGPRYSIVRRIPYDRANTTMSPFAMCEACWREYHDPLDRRFHAQPTNCHGCGPTLRLIGTDGTPIAGDPIAAAARILASGGIVAIKGLGGYHLACRADLDATVTRLRTAKHRLWKPFAIMCASLGVARELIELTDRAVEHLTSSAAPIVLARINKTKRLDVTAQSGSTRKHEDTKDTNTSECSFVPFVPSCTDSAPRVAPAVAPQAHRLGVMLPYTPLQHLLFNEGQGSFDVLVMTSANDSDEPLIYDDVDALAKLAPLCDAILTHDRAIERPVDDSVVLSRADGAVTMVRRARGYVPSPILLPQRMKPGLCLGADLKSAVAVVRDGQVILSQHLGDLQHARGYALLKRTIHDLMQLFAVRPQWIAHDLHPGYFSTRAARELSTELGLPLIPVQHHHAHAAAVLAEHGIVEPALAIVCDGTGYGADGSIWGGEVLRIDGTGFERMAHLKPMRLPGGDSAARHPWRSALALLWQTYGQGIPPAALESLRAFAPLQDIEFVLAMLQAGTACSSTSSTGRVFDAFSALLGLAGDNHYEGYAPALLEAAAVGEVEAEALYTVSDGVIDLGALVRWTLMRLSSSNEHAVKDIAATLHDQLARAFAEAVASASEQTGLTTVALSGGVFINELFSTNLEARLCAAGLTVLRHEQTPPNDGGIALGQAYVAMCTNRLKNEVL